MPAQASMEMISRETFEGVKTLNREAPGNLGAWEYGSWHCRPGGPRVAGTTGPGWSADSQGVHVRTTWNLDLPAFNVAQNAGMVGCWVRFENLENAGYFNSGLSANPAMIFQISCGEDNAPFQRIGVTRTGQLLTRRTDRWVVSSVIQIRTWYWFQIEWAKMDQGLVSRASFQKLGGSLIELSTESSHFDTITRHAYVMNEPHIDADYQHYTWGGRIGGVTLASISDLGEGGQMADLLQPEETTFTWYLNPATGDDHNDGLSPSKAWKTVKKFNRESTHSGLFAPLSGGYSKGDTLIIDTSESPLDLGSEQMTVKTSGLTLKPALGQQSIQIKADKNISGQATKWVRLNTEVHSNVWMTTDAGADDLTDVVIWENDRWLNHPTGVSLSNVIGMLNSVPGSFFSDGTTLYLHPFGSSNPNTDGKVYTRSRFRSQGASAVMLLAPDLRIVGLDVRRTALATSATNEPYTAYGIQGDQGFGGVTLLSKCYVSYAGKHCIGFTDSNSGRSVTVDSCQVEQGTPYHSQTPWVDYNGNGGASNSRTTYINCINCRPTGKIGGTEGATQECLSYLMHNNGTGTQFSKIQFIGGLYGGQISTYGGVDEFLLDGVTFGGGSSAANQTNVNRCVITQLPMGSSAPGSVLTARNNLCIFSDGIFNASFNSPAIGTMTYEGNTFDLRPFSRSDNAIFSLFNRIGPMALTFRNNIIISPESKSFNLLNHAEISDELEFANNFYQGGQNPIIVNGFNDGVMVAPRTFSQWQALGYDEGSQIGSAQLDARYVPPPDSPAANAGANIGAMPDFSGRYFPARHTIGAIEPWESFVVWQARHFNEDELGNPGFSGPNADYDNDGLANLMEFALGLNPRLPDQASQMAATMTADRRFNLEFRKTVLAQGLAWIPEVSSDLITWHDEADAFSEESSGPFLDGSMAVRYSATQPMDETRRFMRMRLEQTRVIEAGE